MRLSLLLAVASMASLASSSGAPRSFPRTAAEERETLRLPAGFHAELVAGEPLIHDPVAAAYDQSGNLWVLEMTRFNAGMVTDLPQLASGVKSVPSSKLVKLESSQGDGHFDRRVVWLDGLNAPRALAIVHDGVLVGDPPLLWLARDLHGSGHCDDKTLLSDHFGVPLINESNANGLVWGRDNILHTICFDHDYLYRGGKLSAIAVDIRGEFGLAQDDFGHLFYNRNSDQLRADLFPAHYALRNPGAETPWVNFQTAASQEVWPGHPTPVVNRGYRKGDLGKQTGGLRVDGTLAEFTAACSPQIYRGANFPGDFYGNAFVPEPAANLIKRNRLVENDGRISAVDAYTGREFLTSSDPWFRPIGLVNAPDGSLVVVDLYRGVLEEYHLITSYLRDQTLAHGLDAPMYGMGRIWKIVHDSGPLETRRPALDTLDAAGLVALLANPNSWWRDTAQQEIVERADPQAIAPLRQLFAAASSPAIRVTALWTLNGLDAAPLPLLAQALRDPAPQVRAAAVRMHERFLTGGGAAEALRQIAPLGRDPAQTVVIQLALSLGECKRPKALAQMAEILRVHGDDSLVRAALVSGLAGREDAFIAQIIPSLNQSAPHSKISPTPTPATPASTISPSPSPAARTSSIRPTPSPAAPTSSISPSPSPAAPTSSISPTPSPAAPASSISPTLSTAAPASSVSPTPSPAAPTSSVSPTLSPAAPASEWRNASKRFGLPQSPPTSEETPSDLPQASAEPMVRQLAAATARAGSADALQALSARMADNGDLPRWARLALIAGLGDAGKSGSRRDGRPVRPLKPAVLDRLVQSNDPAVSAAAQEVRTRAVRAQKLLLARATAGRPLTPEESKRADSGRITFQICAGCHQPTGTGLPNVAPSLVDSPLVSGNPESLVRIVLNGKEGTPGFPGAMPPIGITFSDDQIAGVLTYVRNSWGLRAGAVSLETLAKVRAQVGSRQAAWTNAELAQAETESAKAANQVFKQPLN
jgi:mono/diheme cytochrome c family protein